jgi:hypothetical protein
MAQEGERFNAERAANAEVEAREAADRAKWDAARVAERAANAAAEAREAADRAAELAAELVAEADAGEPGSASY